MLCSLITLNDPQFINRLYNIICTEPRRKLSGTITDIASESDFKAISMEQIAATADRNLYAIFPTHANSIQLSSFLGDNEQICHVHYRYTAAKRLVKFESKCDILFVS